MAAEPSNAGRGSRKRRKRTCSPAPGNLAGEATGGAVLEAVAQLWMTGDERNPLRGDVLRLGTWPQALPGR